MSCVIEACLLYTSMLAMYPNTSAVTEKAMSDEIEDLPYVKSVTSMSNTLPEGIPEEFLPYSITSELHTKDYCRMLIYIRTKTESEQAFKGADEIRDILERYYPENSYLVGETPSTQDIKTTITADNSRVNLLSMLGAVSYTHLPETFLCVYLRKGCGQHSHFRRRSHRRKRLCFCAAGEPILCDGRLLSAPYSGLCGALQPHLI